MGCTIRDIRNALLQGLVENYPLYSDFLNEEELTGAKVVNKVEDRFDIIMYNTQDHKTTSTKYTIKIEAKP